MLLKPRLSDYRIIGFYLGVVTNIIGYLMIIPFITAIIFKEYDPMLDYLIGGSFAICLGLFLQIICRTNKDLDWMHSMTVVALGWLNAVMIAAIPLFLSGHYGSYLDAVFETMSSYTTTGLVLVQNLDHMSMAHNMWRHLVTFVGGQGILIIALSFLISGMSGAFRLYVGEGRDEKIFPNVVHTARFIWLVSFIFLILGTIVMTVIMTFEGMPLIRAIFHSMWLFMGGFDTSGFAPQSQNILYYHSFGLEIALIFIIVLGAFNFNLHYSVWTGNRQEIWRNIELVVFFISIAVTFSLTAIALAQHGVYPEAMNLFRKGFFQLISGHTTTGFMTIYARQFVLEWGHFAMTGVIIAMGVGGCICSTAGGIKNLRLGIIFKALRQDIKQLLLSESAVVSEKFHHIKDIFLSDKLVRSALMITSLYIFSYLIGTVVGLCYGYPFLESTFESVSAAANVGLSCGITQPTMPTLLKITYILQMWTGRLEFLSVFALITFVWTSWRGK